MKTINANLLLAAAVCACIGAVEQAAGAFTQIDVDLPGVTNSSLAWGDYDNDGRLDLAMAGDTIAGPISRIFHNNADNTFTEINAGLTGVRYCSLAWGDYDNDGRLDLALAGEAAVGYVSKIYHNNGNGTFTDINAGLPGARYCSLAWGDFNNDGHLDLAVAGEMFTGLTSTIYRNNGNGTFTNSVTFLPGVWRCSIAAGDYDNDGDLDLALAGATTTSCLSTIYRNNGDGAFTDISAGLTAVYHSSLAWGDYDNDGDLDLALAGFTGALSGTKRVSIIYRNNGNDTFTDIAAALTAVQRGSLAWGDYDNDGDADLAVTGWDGGRAVSIIYRNNGGGTFTDISAGFPGMESGSLAWGDYDNDGDLDLALPGDSGSRICRNDGAVFNAPPTAPWGLVSSFALAGITFSWNAVTDVQTPVGGLSYNLRVGTNPGGSDVFCGMTDPTSGRRRLPAIGNAQKRLSWTLKCPGAGPYYWSVQAIDTAFAGSPWAAEMTVSPPDADGDGDPDVIDCAADDPAIHGGAVEICNDGVDNDCDGLIDAADPQCQPGAGQTLAFYRDADGDGYGVATDVALALTAPDGYVGNNTDCNDADAEIHPGAGEVCNDGVDNDCNGRIDGADPACGCGMCGIGMGTMMPLTILGWVALRGFGGKRRT